MSVSTPLLNTPQDSQRKTPNRSAQASINPPDSDVNERFHRHLSPKENEAANATAKHNRDSSGEQQQQSDDEPHQRVLTADGHGLLPGDKMLKTIGISTSNTPTPLINDLCHKISQLVDKMWVTSSTIAGNQSDIILQLKHGTLTNTNLHIRQSEKGLSIQFITSDSQSAQLLATNQLQLRRQLQKKYTIDAIEIEHTVADQPHNKHTEAHPLWT